MTTPTTELATITEYGPPYWDDRAWDADRIAQRERRLFRALHTGDEAKVLKQVESLHIRYQDMREDYGKSCAFVLDYVLMPDTWQEWGKFAEDLAETQRKTRAFAVDMP